MDHGCHWTALQKVFSLFASKLMDHVAKIQDPCLTTSLEAACFKLGSPCSSPWLWHMDHERHLMATRTVVFASTLP